MIKHLQIASIVVTDQDRAQDFYVNTMGFKVRNDMAMPGGVRWLEVVPEEGQTSFSLEPVAASELVAGKHSGYIFATDDIAASYKELSERGVHFVQPPTFQGWGTYGEFEDPDGNVFGLAQMNNMEGG